MPSGMAVIVFLFAIVSCLPDSHDLAGRSQTAPGEKHKRDGRSVWHTGPGGAPAPEIDWSILHGKSQKLPYCPVDPVTADFLKKIRKDLGNQADSTLKHRASRGTKGLRVSVNEQCRAVPNIHTYIKSRSPQGFSTTTYNYTVLFFETDMNRPR